MDRYKHKRTRKAVHRTLQCNLQHCVLTQQSNEDSSLPHSAAVSDKSCARANLLHKTRRIKTNHHKEPSLLTVQTMQKLAILRISGALYSTSLPVSTLYSC